MNVLYWLHATWTLHRARHIERLRNAPRDGGYSTEAVIITALLAVLALTAIGIIAAKVIARANSITLD